MKKYLFTALLSIAFTGCGHVIKTKPTQLKNGIPYSCQDRQGKYSLVTSILSKGQYNAKPASYKPINNQQGFIAYDFNKDRKTDYFFLERLGSDIRLVSCLSGTRKVTPFKVHETIEPDFQTISESIRLDNESLVLIINKHEHNWGSDIDISRYSFNHKINDFILDQREIISSSGDGLRSDTTEFYSLQKKRYRRTNTCGGLEEGCKSSKSKGRLIMPKVQPTLFKPSKAYARLVPD